MHNKVYWNKWSTLCYNNIGAFAILKKKLEWVSFMASTGHKLLTLISL